MIHRPGSVPTRTGVVVTPATWADHRVIFVLEEISVRNREENRDTSQRHLLYNTC